MYYLHAPLPSTNPTGPKIRSSPTQSILINREITSSGKEETRVVLVTMFPLITETGKIFRCPPPLWFESTRRGIDHEPLAIITSRVLKDAWLGWMDSGSSKAKSNVVALWLKRRRHQLLGLHEFTSQCSL